MKTVYDKIEKVLALSPKPLGAHEFVLVHGFHLGSEAEGHANALRWIGITEASLARRLREMREFGRVTSQRRERTAFVEYALAVKVPAPEPVCPI